MGTAKLLTDTTTICGSDEEERVVHKRVVHNEVERRRKIKINNWIYRLGDLLPGCADKKPSKNWILERAVEYVKELQDTNEKLVLGHCAEVQVAEFQSMKSRIQDLEKRNSELVHLVETSGASVDLSDIWQNRAKYSQKIDPECLSLIATSDKLSPLPVSEAGGKIIDSLAAGANPKTQSLKSTLLAVSCSHAVDILASKNRITLEQAGENASTTISAIQTLSISSDNPTLKEPQQASKLHDGTDNPMCAVSASLTLNGNVTAVTQALPGLPIMSTNPHTSSSQQLVPHMPQHLPVLNYGNTVNIFPGGQAQPMIIINEQGIPLIHNVLPGQVILNPNNGQPINYAPPCSMPGSSVTENRGSICTSVVLNPVGVQQGTSCSNPCLTNTASSGQTVSMNSLGNNVSGQIILNTAGTNVSTSQIVQTVPNSALSSGLPTLINSAIAHPLLQGSSSAPGSGHIIITSSTSPTTNVTHTAPGDNSVCESVVLSTAVKYVTSPESADRSYSLLGQPPFLSSHSNPVQLVTQSTGSSMQTASLPSALLLPNGQIIPVVSQPSLIYPGSAPISGGLLMAPPPQSAQAFVSASKTTVSEAVNVQPPKSNLQPHPIAIRGNSGGASVTTTTSPTKLAGISSVISDSVAAFGSSVVRTVPSSIEVGGLASSGETKKLPKRCQRAIKPKPTSQSKPHLNSNVLSINSTVESEPSVSSASATLTNCSSQNRQLPDLLQVNKVKDTETATDILAKATESIFSVGEPAPCVSSIYHSNRSDPSSQRCINGLINNACPATKSNKKCDFSLTDSLNSSMENAARSSKEFNVEKATDVLSKLVPNVCNMGIRDMPLLHPVSPVGVSTSVSQTLPSEVSGNTLTESYGKSIAMNDDQAPCLSAVASAVPQDLKEPLQKRNPSVTESSGSPPNKRSRCTEHETNEIPTSNAVSSVNFLSVSQLASSSFSIDTALCADNSPLGSISPLLVSPTKSVSSDGFLGTAASSSQFAGGGCNSNEDSVDCVTRPSVSSCPIQKRTSTCDITNASVKLKVSNLSNSTIHSDGCEIAANTTSNLPVTEMVHTYVSNCVASTLITSTSPTESSLSRGSHFSTSVSMCNTHNTSAVLQNPSNYLTDNHGSCSSTTVTPTYTSNLSVLPRVTELSSTHGTSLTNSQIKTVASNHTFTSSPTYSRNVSVQSSTFEVSGGTDLGGGVVNPTLPSSEFSTNSLTNSFTNNNINSGQTVTESTHLPLDEVPENVPSFNFGHFSPVTVPQQQLIRASSHMSLSQSFTQAHCLPPSNGSRHPSLLNRISRIADVSASNEANKIKENNPSRTSSVDEILSPQELVTRAGVQTLVQSLSLSHTSPQPEICKQSQQPSPTSGASPAFQPQRSVGGSTNYSAEALIGHSSYPATPKESFQQRVSRVGISYSAESLIQNQPERRSLCSQSGPQRHRSNVLAVPNQFSAPPSYNCTSTTQSLPYFSFQPGADKPDTGQSSSLSHFQHGKNTCLVPNQQSEISFSFSLAQPNHANSTVTTNQASNGSTQPATTYPNLFHYPHSAAVVHNSKQSVNMLGADGLSLQADCNSHSNRVQAQCANNGTYTAQSSTAPMLQGHFVNNNSRNAIAINSGSSMGPDKVKGKHETKNAKIGKHVGLNKKKSYSVEEVNLSNSIFETNRSVTPYFAIPTLSPPRNEAPTYIPNPSNLFTASNRPLSANASQQNKPADIGTPYNPLFTSRSQTGLNLNFQAPGFGMNHIRSNTASTQLSTHSNMPNFNLSNIFPDISSSGDNLNVSPIKFHPANPILPAETQHHQPTALYNRPVLHNGMSINSLLAHNGHGFDGRPPVPVAINNAMAPPSFHGHNHAASFSNVIPTLNFSMHEH